MKSAEDAPIFFTKPVVFRAWLEKHHQTKRERWVGFHRKASGRPSITWPEAVDEALCYGWIDGLRKAIDAESYKIRFTPRRLTSNWSAINIRRMKELMREGRVRPGGIKAFQKRVPERSGIYSYENRKSATLSAGGKKRFRADLVAWKFFQRQPASYRQTAIWWVISAKRPQTQEDRLRKLIALSKGGRRL
ncbi:MAG: bacteriocin-protection protein [Verrucomicrobia bacterium]|nr:MAG: bacteriocin-protection protein [Verrucomicrobiota bacterium]